MKTDKATAARSDAVVKEFDAPGIQVLSRAADILRAVSGESEPPSLGRIATLTNLPRSTVQRIVSALISEGLLATGHHGGGYLIGSTIQQLAEEGRPDVRKRLHPLLVSLSESTAETVDLAICRNHQMVFIDQVSGRQRLRAVSAIGEQFSMTDTANGKAVMALKQKEAVEAILVKETGKKVSTTQLQGLTVELNKVRKLGYGLDLDEHTPGISAVGIAFCVNGSYYAISIPAPTHRFKLHRQMFIDELLNAKTVIKGVLPDCVF